MSWKNYLNYFSVKKRDDGMWAVYLFPYDPEKMVCVGTRTTKREAIWHRRVLADALWRIVEEQR